MVDAVVAAAGLVKPCGITSIQIQFFKCFPKHAIRSTIIKADSDCAAFTFLYVFYFHICSIFKISGDRYSCNSNLRIGTRQSRCLASISCLFSSTHIKVSLLLHSGHLSAPHGRSICAPHKTHLTQSPCCTLRMFLFSYLSFYHLQLSLLRSTNVSYISE